VHRSAPGKVSAPPRPLWRYRSGCGLRRVLAATFLEDPMSLPLVHWMADPVAISLGPLAVRWYGLLFVGAFLLGDWMVNAMYRREHRPDVNVSSLLIYALAGTIIGARLAHCLFYDPDYYLSHPIKIFAIWEGGLASHGGAVGMLVGLAIGARQLRGVSYLDLLDHISLPCALGGALVRIANFVNAEILGRPTDGSWGVIFDAVDQVPRHPVQLYEATAYLAIFAVLLLLYQRLHQRFAASRGEGILTGVLLALVFAARFVLETWKEPQAAFEAGFRISVGQWLSVPFVVCGIWLVWRGIRARRRQGAA
jgi:prolipoprotein diacylglyceryl transferase